MFGIYGPDFLYVIFGLLNFECRIGLIWAWNGENRNLLREIVKLLGGNHDIFGRSNSEDVKKITNFSLQTL